MKSVLAGAVVHWAFHGADRVFFVYGMRRSGNHACVGWLVNALEGKPVQLVEELQAPNFNWSTSGSSLFVNDISTIHGSKCLRWLYRHRRRIRRARFVVISAEDEGGTYTDDWRIPAGSEAIQVQHGTLNLMASRFQNLNRRAQEGLGAHMQSMKGRFFATLEATVAHPRGARWELERWHDDAEWRRAFLARIGLDQDILPPMVGLGSSFSYCRSLPTGSQMKQRFEMVEPWSAWVAFVQRAASEYPGVFTAAEHDSIAELVDKSGRTPAGMHAVGP